MMRWLRREAFRSYHSGVGRMNVVSHSWGEVIGAVVLSVAIVVGAFYFVLAFGYA